MKLISDKQLINALIARDEGITRQFFFGSCRPLFLSIIRNIFSYEVDYDEFVNEFYLYLMENDAYRLRQFEGRSSIYQWLKVIAIRYFIAKRDRMIDMQSEEPLLECVKQKETVDTVTSTQAKIDIGRLLSIMPNRRYVYVIRRLVLHDADPNVVAKELMVNVDNLYNIKKRAIAALTDIALNESGKYETKIKK